MFILIRQLQRSWTRLCSPIFRLIQWTSWFSILRVPSNHLETATITGYWEATGEPADEGCDGYDEFSIPILVSDQEPKWQINLVTGELIDLRTGYPCALDIRLPDGALGDLGIGQKFRVPPEMTEGYFQRSKQTGGFVNGMITDPFGNPIPGIGLDLLYGGSPATFDSLGNFSFASRQPKGMNVKKNHQSDWRQSQRGC